MANVYNKPIVIGGGGSEECVDYLGLRISPTQNYEYTNNDITYISSYAFAYDHKVKKLTFLNAVTISDYSFNNCQVLEKINVPNARTLGQQAFYACYAIKEITFPKVQLVGETCFRNCYQLKSVNFEQLETLARYMFRDCYSLLAVIIQSPNVVSGGSDMFRDAYHFSGTQNSTYNPTGAKDGYIYVPDGLVASYKSASYWSAVASQIKGLSELPQEYVDLYDIQLPTGYTLTLQAPSELVNSNLYSFSIDDGVTWNTITNTTTTLSNVSKIKFKNDSSLWAMRVGSSLNNNDIAQVYINGYVSENITVSSNTTFYLTLQGGGGASD